MHCADLFEDAEDDLASVSRAQKYAYAFMNWLEQHNKDTPLNDIEGFIYWENTTSKGLPLKVLSISAWRLGLPMDDLSFGIGWTDRGDEGTERAMLLAGRQENRRHYYALLIAKHDPRQETDVLWGLSTHSMVHEIIHYFDYVRGYNDALYRQKQWQAQRERETGKRPPEKHEDWDRKYYNSPLEFNAHFHQALAEVFASLASNIAQQKHYGMASEIKWLSSFAAFYERFQDIADRQKYFWLAALSRQNKHKVVRRLYKLYVLIKRQWPNLRAVQQQAAEFVQKWQEDDVRSASSADTTDTGASSATYVAAS